jgi:hypothetical protein
LTSGCGKAGLQRCSAKSRASYPDAAQRIGQSRPLVLLASAGEDLLLEEALEAEEKQKRDLDREYWKPLRAELERLRHR